MIMSSWSMMDGYLNVKYKDKMRWNKIAQHSVIKGNYLPGVINCKPQLGLIISLYLTRHPSPWIWFDLPTWLVAYLVLKLTRYYNYAIRISQFTMSNLLFYNQAMLMWQHWGTENDPNNCVLGLYFNIAQYIRICMFSYTAIASMFKFSMTSQLLSVYSKSTVILLADVINLFGVNVILELEYSII